MSKIFPPGLPLGLRSGRSYQVVSPLMRSELASGRARQRRRFTSVPEMVSISWIFNDLAAGAFEAWFRDALIDGAEWFQMPLDTPLGLQDFDCRFTDIYQGPNSIGHELWGYSAELEIRERAALAPGWGEFPELVLGAEIFDYAMNREWPLSPWQIHAEAFDTAINEDWPQP